MRIINNNLIIMVYPCPKRQSINLLKKIEMRKINNLRDYFLIFFYLYAHWMQQLCIRITELFPNQISISEDQSCFKFSLFC